MTWKSLILIVLSSFALMASDAKVAVSHVKLLSSTGGTDFRLAFNSDNASVTAYVLNVSVDNGGQMESISRVIQRSRLPGVPDRQVWTFTTVSVTEAPEKVKVVRVTITPIRAYAEDAITIEPDQ